MASRLREGKHQVTLSRALSKLGFASRAQAGALIRAGKVYLGGKVVRTPDIWVDPKHERIFVEGVPVKPHRKVYLALNKPAGIVTTRSDERGRTTVYHLLPPGLPRVFPVGRLDKDTSGLLLFTNDTRFGEAVTNPRTKVPKRYVVQLDKRLDSVTVRRLESPVILEDGTELEPSRVRLVRDDGFVCELTIREGKNRQIRRAFDRLGFKVLALQRIAIGGIMLGNLREGDCRFLSDLERSTIRTQVDNRSTFA